MNDRQTSPELQAALASLAAEDANAAPPADLETRLLAEFSTAPPPAVRAPLRAWAAAAAAAVVTGAMLLQNAPEPKAAETPFVQVPFVPPPAPYERIELVRQNVPIAALIAAGFDVHVPDAGGALAADVLRGQDGRAIAIRLVTDSSSKFEGRIDQ